MTNKKDEIKYYINTYSQYSHNYLVAILSSNGADYRYEQLQNEECYSRFVVITNLAIYNVVKQLIDNNDGTSISIEYGPY